MTVELDDIVIRKGIGEDGKTNCVMQWVTILSGQHQYGQEEVTDHPSCTNKMVTELAIRINDRLNDEDRQRLKPFIPRLLNAKRTDKDERIGMRIYLSLNERARQRFEPREDDEFNKAVLVAEEVVRAWLRGEVEEAELLKALKEPRKHLPNAYAYAYAYANAYAYAYAYANADAYAYAYAYAYANANAYANAYADADANANAYAYANAYELIDLLDDVLTYHEKALAEEGEAVEVCDIERSEAEFLSFVDSLLADTRQ